MSNPISIITGHFGTLLLPYSLCCQTLLFSCVFSAVLLPTPLAQHSDGHGMDS